MTKCTMERTRIPKSFRTHGHADANVVSAVDPEACWSALREIVSILNELDLEFVAILSIYPRTIIQQDIADRHSVFGKRSDFRFLADSLASLLLKHARQVRLRVDARVSRWKARRSLAWRYLYGLLDGHGSSLGHADDARPICDRAVTVSLGHDRIRSYARRAEIIAINIPSLNASRRNVYYGISGRASAFVSAVSKHRGIVVARPRNPAGNALSQSAYFPLTRPYSRKKFGSCWIHGSSLINPVFSASSAPARSRVLNFSRVLHRYTASAVHSLAPAHS